MMKLKMTQVNIVEQTEGGREYMMSVTLYARINSKGFYLLNCPNGVKKTGLMYVHLYVLLSSV